MPDITTAKQNYNDSAARARKFLEDRGAFDEALTSTINKKVDNYAPLEAAKNKALAEAGTMYLTNPAELEGTSFGVKYNNLAAKVRNALANFYTSSDVLSNAKGTVQDILNTGRGIYQDKAALQNNDSNMAYQTLRDMITDQGNSDAMARQKMLDEEEKRRYNTEWQYKVAQDALANKQTSTRANTPYPTLTSNFKTNGTAPLTPTGTGKSVYVDDKTGDAVFYDALTGKVMGSEMNSRSMSTTPTMSVNKPKPIPMPTNRVAKGQNRDGSYIY